MGRRSWIVSLIFLFLVASWTPAVENALQDPSYVQETLSNDVNGSDDYTVVYQLDIPDEAEYNNDPIPYSIDSSSTIDFDFDRIAYYLELEKPNEGRTWVFVSFPSITTRTDEVGVPTYTSGIVHNQLLTDVEIQSNHPNLLLKDMPLKVSLLTGSVKKSERTGIHEGLENGDIHILVGTHALLEDKVKFKNIGFVVIDEQHRFGVAQRAKMWLKNSKPPHILVMTATPIPRTLAMTLYGDLDISVIDELPPGRKEIKTIWKSDSGRLNMLGFIQKEIEKGRQAYIVYPLINESEKLDYKDLMDGYESICRKLKDYNISIVHGQMKSEDKDFEMNRFVKGETQIMVATTVIEVGVNVPNASIMVIESAERFGLSQLHQLRGRVGRGAEQSYCILMSGNKISTEGQERLKTMVRTTDGFEIAEVDLKLRGPGDLMGTQQSGMLELKIADLIKDNAILNYARQLALEVLKEDPSLKLPKNKSILNHYKEVSNRQVEWSRIS